MLSWGRRVLRLVVISGSCAGCVPGALPPARISVSQATDAQEKQRERPAASETVFRASLDPQQLFESQASRVVDFGAGYRVGATQGAGTVHGPISELGFYPFHVEHLHTRFGLNNVGELLFDSARPGAEPGWAYTLALSAELSGFVSDAGTYKDHGEGGAYAAHGEVGVGLFAGYTHRNLDGMDSDMFLAGLSARLPAAAFIYMCGNCMFEVH